MAEFNLLSAVAALIDGGGPFVIWIFGSGVLMWALILERSLYFFLLLPREAEALHRQWMERSEHSSWCARQIRQMFISRLNANMSTGFPLMQVLVPLSPLLGLVGTVSGMLEVFDVMAIKGQSDPKSMADGISHAMIATLSGLAVALSGLYFAHHFQARATRETERLNVLLALEDHEVSA